MQRRILLVRTFALLALAATSVSGLRAEEPAKAPEADHVISLSEDRLELIAPEAWKREEPRSRIIEHEFSIPAAEGDENPGRMTIMAAGGSVEDNVARWYAQFKQPDGGATKNNAEEEKKEIGGVEVHFVDITGTFIDRPSPMQKGVERENYRMLGVILVGDKIGQQFIKFTGPAKTVEENAEAFAKMVEELKVK
jgi:hypothetical protein